jgi:hypothetical protein
MLQRGHEREPDRLPRLVARLRPGGRVGESVDQGVGVGLEPDRLDCAGGLGRLDHRWDLLWAAAAVAKRVQTAIGCDPVEPGAQGGAPLEALQPAPGRQQRFLGGVLGILQRAEDSVAMQLQLPAVRLDQHSEGMLVARAGPLEGVPAHDRMPD